MGENIESKEFEQCLKNGRIKKFPQAKILAEKEVKTAHDDLKIALESLTRGNAKWAIIQAYYAMFHAARALIFSSGGLAIG